jgi:hypothetical protein
VILEIDTLEGFPFQVLAGVVEEGRHPLDVLFKLALALRDLLSLGLRLVQLRLELAAARLVQDQVALGYLQVLRLLLKPV